MKVSLNRVVLDELLKKAEIGLGAASKESPVNYFAFKVEDDRVAVSANNMSSFITTSMAGEVQQPGALLIEGKRLIQLIRALDSEEITIEYDPKQDSLVRVSYGSSPGIVLRSRPYNDMEPFSDILQDVKLVQRMDKQVLLDGVTFCRNFVDKDASSQYKVVEISQGRVVAGSSSRVGILSSEALGTYAAVFGPSAQKSVVSFLEKLPDDVENPTEVVIAENDQFMVFNAGPYGILGTKKVDERLPDIAGVGLAEDFEGVIVDKEYIRRLVERASIVFETSGNVSFLVTGDANKATMRVTAIGDSGRTSDETFLCKRDENTKAIQLAFTLKNTTFTDVLRWLKGGTVTMRISQGMNMVEVVEVGTNYRANCFLSMVADTNPTI